MTCESRPASPRAWLIAGTTGIAAATAELAASQGINLFLTGRKAEHGEPLRDAMRQRGVSCEFLAADLADPASHDRIVAGCVAAFGKVDAAFLVAGISGRRFGDGPVHECTPEGWDTVMNTNGRGLFLLCGAVLRQMLSQPLGPNGLRGTILNMASVLAWSPSPHFFATHAYAASKAAIIGFSRAMAAHYASERIRVNVIAPALVRTPMSQRAQQDPLILEFMKTKQPLTGDLLGADQVARAALFLLGDDASGITGDVLTVDGGWCVSEGQIP
ncbi:MAG: SDR family oxidoreductase [Verrucomicrobiales bacterium]|nr:SDR family oxidoreductase [Verrucomicrobiales bacterium]